MMKLACQIAVVVGALLVTTALPPAADAEALTATVSYDGADPADFTPAQRSQLNQDINDVTTAQANLQRQMDMYRRAGQPVPPKLIAEEERLKTRLAKLTELGEAVKAAPMAQPPATEGRKPAHPTPPVTAETDRAAIASAIALAKQIVANDKEFAESVESAARAHLTTDNERIKEADRRKYKAFDAWSKLRRERPTVPLQELLTFCPAEHRGDWAALSRWTKAQGEAFNSWTDQWTEVRIKVEGEIESASFRKPDRAEVRTTMRANIGGSTIALPMTIAADSTRAFMLEKAQRGDRIRGEAVIRKAGDLALSATGATVPLELELETAELYRPKPGSEEMVRVWPDLTEVAKRSVALRQSFEREHGRSADVYQKARNDASLHEKAVQAYIAYENKHVARPFIWHPRVTVEQWFAGCPDDAHGPWESLDQWSDAQKKAFTRWIGGSYDVKLLSDLKVEQIGEERASDRVTLSRQITIGRTPITLILKDYAKRKVPVGEGETFYATMSLGSYNKTEFEDGRITLTFNTNLHICSKTPITLDGKPK